MIKISAFCADKRSYEILQKVYSGELIPKVLRSSATHLSPIAAEVISLIATFESEKVADEFLIYWAQLNKSSNQNEKRLFIDVLVPKVLKVRKELAQLVLKKCEANCDEFSIQFAILVNKCLGREFEKCSISIEAFSRLLKSPNIDLRLSTLAYIVTSKKITQPLTENILTLVQNGLLINFNLQKPFHRKILENLLEHFMQRLGSSWSEQYQPFFLWLLKTSLSELCPSSALPRIKTVLFILGQISDVKNESFVKFRIDILKGDIGLTLHRSLISQLSNSFADVNHAAFDILIRLQSLFDRPVLLPRKQTENYTQEIISRLQTDNTLSSCTGLSCELCYAIIIEAEKEKIPLPRLASNIIMEIIELVQSDMKSLTLLEACQTKPHYNLLSSIQMLLPYAKEAPDSVGKLLVEKILEICFESAEYAEPVVNSNSPEGFLPDGFSVKGRQIWHTLGWFFNLSFFSSFDHSKTALVENKTLCRSLFSVDQEQDATEIAKQLLVMAWRMMKASSTMLGLLGSVFVLDLKTAKIIGDHLIDQLTRARHRGAFELAAEAFRALCIQTRGSEETKHLLDSWCDQCLLIITDKTKIDALCQARLIDTRDL